MKVKGILLSFVLIMFTMMPIKAEIKHSILIASKQLPYLIYAEVENEKTMNVNFIPRTMKIPMVCKNQQVQPMIQMDLKENFTCVKESSENFYEFKAQRYVYVHLNRIAKDLKLPYKNIDFHVIGNITDYFANVVKKMKLSTILNYANYIESDLKLSDYYDYYQMFKGKKVNIQYAISNVVYMNTYALPLDNRFHKIKTAK